MPETMTAPAPAAATAPAPAAPASPAVSSTPASAPAAPVFGGRGSVPSSTVDPNKYPIREDYAAALLTEKLSAIPQGLEETEPAALPGLIEENATSQGAAAPEAAAASDAGSNEWPELEEETFRLDDAPRTITTPEVMARLLQEKPEFGKLLETDPELKETLWHTSRAAAEAEKFRQLFPDVAAAKDAADGNTTWNDVRGAFMAATTREGTLGVLGKIAELSFERDAQGQPLMRDGRPVIGSDFYGFLDNVVSLDHENRITELQESLRQNLYRTDSERARDERALAALEILREYDEETAPAVPAERRAADLDRRERALREQERGKEVDARAEFETGLKTEAQNRISNSINRIFAHVESQGGTLSPYLKNTLPQTIAGKLVARINGDQALKQQMRNLQLLPANAETRQRRISAIDTAIRRYLPAVAREELREAGVQMASASAARRAKVDAQIDSTLRTETRGSTGPANGSSSMSSNAAFDHAQAEWQRANPGRVFDKAARDTILPRVLALMTGRR